jgi:NTE family protein
MTRVGLALGAGGVVGHAFHDGVLAAIRDVTGWDPRRADVIAGTSAGAVVAATLRAEVAPGPGRSGPDIPGRPTRRGPPRLAAPGALVRLAFQPWHARFGTVTAALLPEGRVPTGPVAEGFRTLYPHGWPARPLFINAVHLDSGRRVTFGRPGAPHTDVATAVAASVAIPGFFAPVTIAGARYVDGGAHSPTNADVLADEGLDIVVVISPMSVAGNPMWPAADLPARRFARFYLGQEVTRLRRGGALVLAIQPHGDDRAVMGLDPMDAGRRARVVDQAYASTTRRLARADAREAVAMLRSTRGAQGPVTG